MDSLHYGPKNKIEGRNSRAANHSVSITKVHCLNEQQQIKIQMDYNWNIDGKTLIMDDVCCVIYDEWCLDDNTCTWWTLLICAWNITAMPKCQNINLWLLQQQKLQIRGDRERYPKCRIVTKITVRL